MAPKQFSLQVRNLIVKDNKNGVSNWSAARKYGVSEGAVRKILQKFKELGTVADKAGRGRKRKTTYLEDRRIVREAKKNPNVTSRTIHENLDLNVSSKTICRRLRENGLKSGFVQRRPLIRKNNRFVDLVILKPMTMIFFSNQNQAPKVC